MDRCITNNVGQPLDNDFGFISYWNNPGCSPESCAHYVNCKCLARMTKDEWESYEEDEIEEDEHDEDEIEEDEHEEDEHDEDEHDEDEIEEDEHDEDEHDEDYWIVPVVPCMKNAIARTVLTINELLKEYIWYEWRDGRRRRIRISKEWYVREWQPEHEDDHFLHEILIDVGSKCRGLNELALEFWGDSLHYEFRVVNERAYGPCCQKMEIAWGKFKDTDIYKEMLDGFEPWDYFLKAQVLAVVKGL